MDSHRDIETELKDRIEDDFRYFKGKLPDIYSIAWRAYLAGLLEWNIIDISMYTSLIELLPSVHEDPSASILRGRE
jgi:hypothetical protein